MSFEFFFFITPNGFQKQGGGIAMERLRHCNGKASVFHWKGDGIAMESQTPFIA